MPATQTSANGRKSLRSRLAGVDPARVGWFRRTFLKRIGFGLSLTLLCAGAVVITGRAQARSTPVRCAVRASERLHTKTCKHPFVRLRVDRLKPIRARPDTISTQPFRGKLQLSDQGESERPSLPAGAGGPPSKPGPQATPAAIPRSARALADRSGVSVFKKIDLSAAGGAAVKVSVVGEPTVARSPSGVAFGTANWFAAFSEDGGRTWHLLDPAADLVHVDYGFCCDQYVEYVASIDRFVWVRQTAQDPDVNGPKKPDRFRISVASPESLIASGGTRWTSYEVTPAEVGLTGEWLDQPNIAASAGYLYLGFNAFPLKRPHPGVGIFPGNIQTGSAVIRLPLESLRRGEAIVAPQSVHFPRSLYPQLANGCGNGALWATEASYSSIRVFDWPDRAATPRARVVDVSQFKGPTAIPLSTTFQKSTWLDGSHGVDGRIRTGACTRTGHVAFAWTDGRDSVFPQSHIHIAWLDSSRLTLAREQFIWNARFAYAWPALSANARGDVGIAFAFGGGALSVHAGVGIIWSDLSTSLVTIGNAGTAAGADYMSVGPAGNETAFVAGVSEADQRPADPSDNCQPTCHDYFVEFGPSGTAPPRDPTLNPPPPTRKATTLTLSSLDGTTSYTGGDSAHVEADLLPAESGDAVSIDVTPPTGSAQHFTGTSDAVGRVRDTIKLDRAGTWLLQAHYAGSVTRRPSDSAVLNLTVGTPAPPGKSSLAMNCPQTAQTGVALTLTAALSPALQGENIKWTATAPDGSSQSQTVQTDATATAYYNLTPGQAGKWSISARWAGNAGHDGTTGGCTIDVQAPSTLTLTCPANLLPPGSAATVTGTLLPAVSASAISITYTPPANSGRQPTTDHSTTDDTGYFADSFGENASGAWTVTASFAGDTTRTPATSTCTFTVLSP